ncbi:hypothetical protein QBC34DRAFT_385228 [Podospora aff. communis PSN243]|uniref:Uncharacterized protein n=1 Tax=Podospora aff. communis PSN243 TaxID=3040156 RepID=A0AAV9G9N4_9PEZI|nr:hypothetical protein QBC34DRAFT_385228 [Podospora aff. communis PSN243]
MCDDLINHLNDAHDIPGLTTPAQRAGLWALVFAGGWDTNCMIHHPGPISNLRPTDTILEIGTFKLDLPASAGSKRDKDGNVLTPAHRRAGAKGHLKPSFSPDDFGITSTICDKNGARANMGMQCLMLRAGWTISQARVCAMGRWERRGEGAGRGL